MATLLKSKESKYLRFSRSQGVWLFMFLSMASVVAAMGYIIYQDQRLVTGSVLAQEQAVEPDRLRLVYETQVERILAGDKTKASEALLQLAVPPEYQQFHFNLITSLDQGKEPPSPSWKN